ncbi:hypothetical protein PENTCL1PPCAC_15292, partial [Pristionchus entomophagus]
ADPRINLGLLWLAVGPGLLYLVYLLRDCTLLYKELVLISVKIRGKMLWQALCVLEIDNLNRRAVFITGCDTGFGNLLALKCARRGMPVFAGCLTDKGAESLRSSAVGLCGKLETIIVDIGSTESVAAAAKHLEQATEQYGGLHGIVNNAGIVGSTFFDDLLNVEQYREVVEVNTFGAIRVTQALKHLVKKTRGRIVTVTSAAARLGFLGVGPYTVSKFALAGYSEVIRQELRYFGVSVHVVEPGMFKTPLTAAENIETKIVACYSTFGSSRADLFSDAYFHALTARFPHLRYQIGTDCKFFILPISYLPTGARDALFAVGEMLLWVLCPMPDPRFNLGLLWLGVGPGALILVYLLKDVAFIWGLAAFATIPVLYVLIQRALSGIELEDLSKRAVFITGCDHGFGNLLALKCARRGMPVFAGCLTEDGAEALRTAATGLPGKLETIIVDVTFTESVAAAAKYLEAATEKYGGLHGVVNNAGVMGCTFFDDLLNVEQYKEVVEVNTFGVIRVTQALKHLVKKTRGRIVTVSSAAARLGFLGMGPYTVSKFAVSGYCEVIRQELRYFGVSVHVLEPGVFKTPMAAEGNVKSRLDQMWDSAPEATKQDYGECFFKQSRKRLAWGLGQFGCSRLDLVIDAYFHALTARFPHLRYQIGADCQFMMLPMSYLPTGLRDALFTVGEMIFRVPVPECA